MTLRHGNRIRRTSGNQVVRDLQAVETGEMFDRGPTETEIRQRAYEIFLSRNGAAGSAEVDWLQADIELHARKNTAISK